MASFPKRAGWDLKFPLTGGIFELGGKCYVRSNILRAVETKDNAKALGVDELNKLKISTLTTNVVPRSIGSPMMQHGFPEAFVLQNPLKSIVILIGPNPTIDIKGAIATER